MIRLIVATSLSLAFASASSSCDIPKTPKNPKEAGKLVTCNVMREPDIAHEPYQLCEIIQDDGTRAMVELDVDSPCALGTRWPDCDS